MFNVAWAKLPAIPEIPRRWRSRSISTYRRRSSFPAWFAVSPSPITIILLSSSSRYVSRIAVFPCYSIPTATEASAPRTITSPRPNPKSFRTAWRFSAGSGMGVCIVGAIEKIIVAASGQRRTTMGTRGTSFWISRRRAISGGIARVATTRWRKAGRHRSLSRLKMEGGRKAMQVKGVSRQPCNQPEQHAVLQGIRRVEGQILSSLVTGINRRGQYLEVILTATGMVTSVSEARNKRGGSKQGRLIGRVLWCRKKANSATTDCLTL